MHQGEQMPPSKRSTIEIVREDGTGLEGKRVLIVDDDARNISPCAARSNFTV